jgi:hypothetical protein
MFFVPCTVIQLCNVNHSSTWETACINAWKTYHIRLHAKYSLPDDERKMFETCRETRIELKH